ncbi:MAG: PAS domain S-box protein [Candidatus Sulfotelmatobacter sp.]
MTLRPEAEQRNKPVAKDEIDPIRRTLLEHDDWYRDLVEHSQDLLGLHDLSGQLLSVNPLPARTLGYNVEELLQIPMRELVVPEYRPQFDEYLAEIARTGAACGFLAILTRSGERRIWKYYNTLRKMGPDSAVVRCIAHDVTDQVLTEKLLRRASRRLLSELRDNDATIRKLGLFRKLVDQSNDAIQVVDLKTFRFLDVNEKACSALGYSREELMALTVFDIDPAIGQSSITQILEGLEKSGFQVMESIHRRKDGSTFPVEISLKRIRLEQDAVVVVAVARDLTERRQAEERLREYERVVEGLDEMIAVVNREYRYVIANRAFLNYRRKQKEEVIGRRVDEVVHSEVFEAVVKDKVDECFLGSVVQYELRYTHPGLGERDLFASYFPIEGTNGVDRIAIILQDVTESRRAEEARHQSELSLRDAKEFSENLIRTANVMILGLDMDGNVNLFNEAAEKITGYTFSELKGKSWSILVPRDRFPEVWEEFDRLVGGTAGPTYENPIITKTGEERYISWRNNHVKVNGKIVATISFGNDITESKRVERALFESEERFRVALKHSPITVFNQDRDLRYTWMYNSPILGPTNDYVGKTPYDFFGAEEAERILQSRRKVLDLGKGTREESKTIIEGDTHYFDTTIEPVFDAAGVTVGLTGASMDITERRQAQEALSQTVDQLRQVTMELEKAKEKLSEEKFYLEQAIDTELGFGEIIGRSGALQELMKKVATVASSDATVLLLGETGTGKELVARALHRLSRRKEKGFIKVNCAAIPSGLLESELFGHEKGAFTGAVVKKIGRLELADQGTLFLDEIGDISIDLQPKLLRVLQDQEFERLGSTQTLRVNFRLVAATNRDLLDSVSRREFRSDLYYRLNVFPIVIPPLRERRQDIPFLVEHFVQRYSTLMNKSITSIPSRTMETLVQWPWPGNIRELENFIERSVILTPGRTLQVPLSELNTAPDESHSDTLHEKERQRILDVLRDSNGQLGGPHGAAARLGLKRTTLQSKLKNLEIDPEVFRARSL